MVKKRVLDVILVILIFAICVVAGIFGYDQYQKYSQEKATNDTGDEITEVLANMPEINAGQLGESTGQSGGRKVLRQASYKGYDIIGKITIDKIKLNYSIISVSNAVTLAKGVTRLYGPYPNEIGNMVLAAHNYNNGTGFNKIQRLVNGDIIKITDISGNTLQYSIYSKFETTGTDTSYLTQNTNGKREVSLVTCTNDGKLRTVIRARQI